MLNKSGIDMRGIRKRPSFLKGWLLPRLAFLATGGFPEKAIASIDITNKCNLRCKHCYFFASPPELELSDNDWVNRFEKLSDDGYKLWSCTWIGGEPLFRKDLIRKLMRHSKINFVVTNGSLALPDWPDVQFHISVDGTEGLHDETRGKGSYAKLRENIVSAADRGLRITLACCLTTLNKDCVDELIREWYPISHVSKCLFDFFTPIKGVDEKLWIPFDEQDRILNKLIAFKRDKKYKDFIGVPERALQLMKSDQRHKAVGKNCLFARKAIALDVSGCTKKPCMLGDGADCSRCGCVVPFYLRSRTGRGQMFRELVGLS